jgi:DNA-directed RNA polymerase specialized sigma24 family protein
MVTIPSERPKETPKCDRALAMHERGLSHWQIAERLRIRARDVNTVIAQGRRRRRQNEQGAA